MNWQAEIAKQNTAYREEHNLPPLRRYTYVRGWEHHYLITDTHTGDVVRTVDSLPWNAKNDVEAIVAKMNEVEHG